MILARFDSSESLMQAVARLRADGAAVETYSAAPPDQESAPAIPIAMLIAGIVGVLAGFGMQTYATVVSYPMNIGGRPDFSWPSYIPFAFETGVLFAVLTGFFGYFLAVRLPHLYDPIDEAPPFREASRDGWFLAVRAPSPHHRALLDEAHPATVEDVAE